MHFTDRTKFVSAPLAELNQLHLEEQPKWLAFKTWLKSKGTPIVNKPSGKWTKDSIRDPLTSLFKNNCAYCGDYSDKNNDGEVDHFFPKELDTTASFIYAWDNYVWACHSCNNKKRSHHPLINPCDKNETNEVYLHSLDGRYLVYSKASFDIKAKFKLTEEQTYVNGKKCPQRRRNVKKQLETIYLNEIKLFTELYSIEFAKNPTSNDTIDVLAKLEKSKLDLKEFLQNEDFVLMKIQTFEKYKEKNLTFTYQYDDFI